MKKQRSFGFVTRTRTGEYALSVLFLRFAAFWTSLIGQWCDDFVGF
jgi:hypothetical protein